MLLCCSSVNTTAVDTMIECYRPQRWHHSLELSSFLRLSKPSFLKEGVLNYQALAISIVMLGNVQKVRVLTELKFERV